MEGRLQIPRPEVYRNGYIADYTSVTRADKEEFGVSGTTVRIKEETREALRELERTTGRRTPDLLACAVDQFRRSLIIAETNAAYAALQRDETEWAAVEEERSEWDATLADGTD